MIWLPEHDRAADERFFLRPKIGKRLKQGGFFTLPGGMGLIKPSSGSWTPADLTSAPQIWFNDASAVTDAGSGACSQWNDISGNSYHAQQGSGGQRPLILPTDQNGRRVLQFDGGDGLVISVSANGVFKNVGSAWLAAVYRTGVTDVSATERPLVFFARNGSTTSRVAMFAGDSAGANVPRYGGRRLDTDSFYGPSATGPHAETWTMLLGLTSYTGRTIDLWINGSINVGLTGQFTGSGNTSNTDSGGNVIGQNVSGTTRYNGKIGEIICGVGLPDSTEIDKLFGYMAHRWGLTSVLPGGHPYKSTPP